MSPKQKVSQLKRLVNKEINKIPLASYEDWGGGGGVDYRGRDKLALWFVKFVAQSKMGEKGITKQERTYWQSVYSLAT